jgi:hypothetical protein
LVEYSSAADVPYTDREAFRFLRTSVVPTLEHDDEAALVRAVRRTVESNDLSILSKLPERQRRRLLAAIESRVEATRPVPSPRALVRLVSAVAVGAEPSAAPGRWLAPPAR